MADTQTQPARRGGGLSKLVLWLLVLGLLAAVWWLASERNLRRFAWRPDESVLTISKGRFFPLGMANIAADDPQLGKVYGPIPIPQGAKVSEQEFDDQTELAGLRGELAFTAARQELLQAAKLVLSARRKLQSVEEGGGEHALEAGPLLRELEGIQGLLEDASQSKPHPTPSTPPPTSPPRQPTAPRQRALAPDAGTAAPSVPR